ncbi:SdpI family protein [Microbacterium sp. X-17]|uniref:SdpI family protein n=1 Tax=Microbacterium sp. X-17 TaxID=3144404 RepID=UPI0031F494A9
MIIPATVLTVLAVLLPIVSALCAGGVLRRNHLVGIRFPALQASDAAWTAGHRAAILPSTVLAVLAVVLLVLSYAVPALALWGSILTMLVAIAGFAWGILAALRAARAA